MRQGAAYQPKVERDGRGHAVVPAINVLLYSAAERPCRLVMPAAATVAAAGATTWVKICLSLERDAPLGYHVYLERERSRRLCAPHGVSPGVVGMRCYMAAPFRCAASVT